MKYIKCLLVNTIAFLRGRLIVFNYDKDQELFLVKESGRVLYFSDFDRGKRLYRNGLKERAEKLANSYQLQLMSWGSGGGAVIDCGANYGDLLLYLDINGFLEHSDYYGFEPSPREYRSISNTYPAANLFCKGLGDKEGKLEFYISNKRGDSSFVRPKRFTHKIYSEVVKLDDFLHHKGIKKIKLLKVEAEGFEPEILSAASYALSISEYVAIDGGYERGVKQEQTFTSQCNILYQSGFEMIGVYFNFGRALFRKIN